MHQGGFGGGSVVILMGMGCLVWVLTGALHESRPEPPIRWWEATPAPVVRPATLAPVDHVYGMSSATGRADELLDSPMLDHPEFAAEVQKWVRFWATKPTRWFPTYMQRMRGFEPTVDSVLAAHGLPWSLRYLPLIESGYSPTAVSRASAVGLWQFMAPTAREMGMRVTRRVDERRDPFKSTEAAADFLVDLRRDFGSWFLALAAYNSGPDRVRRLVARHAPGREPSDSLYWTIRPYLPQETRDYVPTFFGAMVVAADPAKYGYRIPGVTGAPEAVTTDR